MGCSSKYLKRTRKQPLVRGEMLWLCSVFSRDPQASAECAIHWRSVTPQTIMDIDQLQALAKTLTSDFAQISRLRINFLEALKAAGQHAPPMGTSLEVDGGGWEFTGSLFGTEVNGRCRVVVLNGRPASLEWRVAANRDEIEVSLLTFYQWADGTLTKTADKHLEGGNICDIGNKRYLIPNLVELMIGPLLESSLFAPSAL